MPDPIRDTDDDDGYEDLVVPEAIDGDGVLLRPNEAVPGRGYTCPRCKTAVYLRIINRRRLHFVHRTKADTITCADLRRREREAEQQAAKLRRDAEEQAAIDAINADRAQRARIRSVAGMEAAKQRAEHDRMVRESWFGPASGVSVPPPAAGIGSDLWSMARSAQRERDDALNRQRAAIDAEFAIRARIQTAATPEERATLEQEWAAARADQDHWKQIAEAAEATRFQAAVALRPPKAKPVPPR